MKIVREANGRRIRSPTSIRVGFIGRFDADSYALPDCHDTIAHAFVLE